MKTVDCPINLNSRRFKKHPALVLNNKIISYADLNARIDLTALHLKKLGVRPQARVAILSPNSCEYIITLFALWRIKAVGCLLSTRIPVDIIAQQMKETKSKILLTPSPDFLNSDQIPVKKINFSDIHHASNIHQSIIHHQFDLNQRATIMYTSGSSAQPKAVMHTLGNHYFSALGSNIRIPVKRHDRWLLSLPLYHVGGLSILFRVFIAGGSIVLPNDPKDFLPCLRRHQVTHFSLVSTQLYRFIQDRKNHAWLRQLKAILLGGSAIPETLLQEIRIRHLPVYATYGMTEMSSQVATSKISSNPDQPPQAEILPYRQLRVSKEGEILLKGRTLFKGYLQGNRIVLPVVQNGWFPSGDLGRVSKKRFLTVTGRKDNMFISGGENIQPEEIERCLNQLEGIEESVVVPVPDEEFGYRPAAFLRCHPSQKLTRNKIISHLKRLLPSFKIPDHFYHLPDHQEVRDGSSLKINRSSLRMLASRQNQQENQ